MESLQNLELSLTPFVRLLTYKLRTAPRGVASDKSIRTARVHSL